MIEVGAMAPDHDHCNIWLLKAYCNGDRKVSIIFAVISGIVRFERHLNWQNLNFSHPNLMQYLLQKDARHYYVPQFEGLDLDSIKEYIYADEVLRLYFPEERDYAILEKKWVCDICYTVKLDEFDNWVKAKIAARNKRAATVKDSQIVMDKKVAEAFLTSSFVSKQKGNAVNLLSKCQIDGGFRANSNQFTDYITEQANKRRRTKAQIDFDNKAAAEEVDRVRRIEDQLEQLTQEQAQMKQEVKEAKFKSDLVNQLANDGVL